MYTSKLREKIEQALEGYLINFVISCGSWGLRYLAVTVYRQISLSIILWKVFQREINTKLHPGSEWGIFYIPTSGDIDDATSFTYWGSCKGGNPTLQDRT